MTRPCRLRRAVTNRHRHAIEQASRRWRGGRRDGSARTRREILISTQVVTDDTDATTFASYYAQNTPRIVKNLFDTEGARLKEKRPAYEIDVQNVLSSLQLSRDAFVDFCVLCGCDYAQKLRGVGPKTALKLIVTHKSLERAVFVERPGVATRRPRGKC